MGLRSVIRKSLRGRDRRLHLRGADTIASIRARRPAEFKRLRELICAAGTDNLKHFGPEYALEGGLCLQQNPDEFAALLVLLRERRPYSFYMEIGSASGGACRLISQEVGFARGLSIDDGKHPRADQQPENFSHIPNLLRHVGDSHAIEARKFLHEQAADKIDLAFVDGDHSYAGVCQDIQLTLDYCRTGSLIVLHDTIACDGVERAWLDGVKNQLFVPLAEFVGDERPLGIAIGSVTDEGA